MSRDVCSARHRTTWSIPNARLLASLGASLLLAAIAVPSERSTLLFLLATCVLVALFLTLGCWGKAAQDRTEAAAGDRLPSRSLKRRPELLQAYHCLRQALIGMAKHSDDILREQTALQLAAMQEELQMLAAGKVVFTATEAWRTAYERVLRSPGLERYLSVAWLRNEEYWRDVPGRHSMQLNYDLIQLGVRIERILILNDFFWPSAAALPAKVVCQWIEEQHGRGVLVRLVRESEIEQEPALLCDFGIYGHRATGQLELDEQCRTVRFTLDFDPRRVRMFEERWCRLLCFAVSFRELLDRKARGE